MDLNELHENLTGEVFLGDGKVGAASDILGPIPTLGETLAGLQNAQDKMVKLINKAITTGIVSNEEIECLTEISDALRGGINYCYHLSATVEAISLS